MQLLIAINRNISRSVSKVMKVSMS